MTYRQEQIKPYSEEGSKGQQVERMFDSIAHSYDLLNHTLSLGLDRSWRKAAVDSLKPYAPQQILDLATGTGDFALLTMERLQPAHITAPISPRACSPLAEKKWKRRDFPIASRCVRKIAWRFLSPTTALMR